MRQSAVKKKTANRLQIHCISSQQKILFKGWKGLNEVNARNPYVCSHLDASSEKPMNTREFLFSGCKKRF